MSKIVKTNISSKITKANRSPLVVSTKIRGVDVDTSKFVKQETPTPATDGAQKLFTCANAYAAGLLDVYLNGLLLFVTTDYVETDPSSGTFTLVTAPDSNEDVKVSYIKA